MTPTRRPDRPPLGGNIPWIVAWRFLRHGRSHLLSGTARAALAATAIGVTAMVIAMALMTGYRDDLEAKLLSGNAAVLAYPLGGTAEGRNGVSRAVLERLDALPGIERAVPVAYAQGTVSPVGPGGKPRDGEAREVTVRGVDPGEGMLSGTGSQLAVDEDGLPGGRLGAELARSLGVGEGDLLRLVVLGFEGDRPRFRYGTVEVRGTFESGFAEFDGGWLVMARDEVHRLTGGRGGEDLVEIAVVDPQDAGTIVAEAELILGAGYLVVDARQLNGELFTALALQQRILFLVLGLIVAVSTFNTASTLVILVRERMRDIGVLATLGVSRRQLRTVFLLYGLFLGTLGTALGVAMGSSVSWALTEFELIRFDPEVAAIYFLSSVPFRVEPADVTAIVAFSLAVTLLACLLPAWLVTRVDPATALRYE